MKYKVFYGGSKCKVWNGNNPYVLNMGKPGRNRHLAEIEAYLEDMDDPTLDDNGDGTITLTFDPIPQEMATWMVESKAVFFNVVRQGIRGMSSNYKKNRHKPSKHLVSDNFPYGWDYQNSDTDMSIPNTQDDRANRILAINELTSGSVTRDISHLYHMRYANSWSGARTDFADDFWLEFYIGFIYFDNMNIPSLYKMSKYDILEEDRGMY